MQWLFDCGVVLGLVLLAWRVMVTPQMFRAVVLFITLGLLLALSWARLDAPDIALAEAAIGAGLTGALLLDAVGEMDSDEQDE
jgi:energy-converting hydrogenase B subunit D